MAKIKFNEDNLNQEQTNEEGNLSPVDEKVSPFHENTLRPEQIGVDDLLINQYMPVLYQAIVNNNVAYMRVYKLMTSKWKIHTLPISVRFMIFIVFTMLLSKTR